VELKFGYAKISELAVSVFKLFWALILSMLKRRQRENKPVIENVLEGVPR
jgi:Na+/H+ antiporter NhaD/arsenite permease-like protein